MNQRKLLGRYGEQLAADYLKKRGYTLLAANYSCRYGEIDLIVQRRGVISFVEVKLRKDGQFSSAADSVDIHKQRRMRTTASLWLAQNECALPATFDVVEVYAPEGARTRSPFITHIPNAFA